MKAPSIIAGLHVANAANIQPSFSVSLPSGQTRIDPLQHSQQSRPFSARAAEQENRSAVALYVRKGRQAAGYRAGHLQARPSARGRTIRAHTSTKTPRRNQRQQSKDRDAAISSPCVPPDPRTTARVPGGKRQLFKIMIATRCRNCIAFWFSIISSLSSAATAIPARL